MGARWSRAFWRPVPTNALPAPQATELARGETQTGSGLEGISKNAKKRMAREVRLKERKQARKAQKKVEQKRKKLQRREEREETMKSIPLEERERLHKERVALMRAGRAEEREKRAQVRNALEKKTRYSICIDLGWNEHMFDKERKSLARQLAYSYSAMRKCTEDGMTPLSMSITGLDDIMKPVMTYVAFGWNTWPVSISEKGLADFHDSDKLVYLTHDAEQVLDTLDPEAVYVIGGIVDRNRLRCATMDKAKKLGIKALRLNLDANISLEHGTPVLTVNHCVEILIHAANGMSWRDAYLKVLPVRKGISTSD